MIDFSAQLEPLRNWLDSLQPRERYIVIAGSIALVFILFYLLIWEPVFNKLEVEQQQYQSQRQLLGWMKDTNQEIQSLRASGNATISQFSNQSVSSLVDRSAVSMGIKNNISKQESGKKGVKIQLRQADFDRVILWLNDMQQKYGIQASNIQFEKQEESGAVNVRLTLDRAS